MTVTDNTDSNITEPEAPHEDPDRFDRIALAVTELNSEIQEMRRDLRRLANQLLAGLVDLAKE